jgi:hypothetical protein
MMRHDECVKRSRPPRRRSLRRLDALLAALLEVLLPGRPAPYVAAGRRMLSEVTGRGGIRLLCSHRWKLPAADRGHLSTRLQAREVK